MFVKKPLDFSVFPSLLLVATLFRLGLNVASTRLVLGDGYAGPGHRRLRQRRRRRLAHHRRGDLPDPGRHPVRRGHQGRRARRRGRRPVHPGRHARQADGHRRRPERRPDHRRRRPGSAAPRSPPRPTSTAPWTAPPSSSRATRSPASSSSSSTSSAASRSACCSAAWRSATRVNTYTLLTIGDGLVTQIPALLMAVSTGMIVTRSNADADMGTTASTQLTQSPQRADDRRQRRHRDGAHPRHADDPVHR